MQYSNFWGSNRSSASQAILRNSWNLRVHYRAHNSRSPVSFRSQIDPVHTLLTQFFNTHFNIILLCTPMSSHRSFPSGLPTKTVHITHLSQRYSCCCCYYYSYVTPTSEELPALLSPITCFQKYGGDLSGKLLPAFWKSLLLSLSAQSKNDYQYMEVPTLFETPINLYRTKVTFAVTQVKA
jgi:hypothetical protein